MRRDTPGDGIREHQSRRNGQKPPPAEKPSEPQAGVMKSGPHLAASQWDHRGSPWAAAKEADGIPGRSAGTKTRRRDRPSSTPQKEIPS